MSTDTCRVKGTAGSALLSRCEDTIERDLSLVATESVVERSDDETIPSIIVDAEYAEQVAAYERAHPEADGVLISTSS